MICQVSYDAAEAVPKKLKEEFELKKGKWVLKKDAIPGVGQFFNPSLDKNNKKAVKQLGELREKHTTLKQELSDLKENSEIPDGGVILSSEDAESFRKFSALGSLEDVTKKVTEHADLSAKVEGIETTKKLGGVAEVIGVSPGVLSSWKGDPDEGKDIVDFISKKEKDENDEEIEVGYVQVEVEENGKKVIKEFLLMDEAKKRLEPWKFQALTAEIETDDEDDKSSESIMTQQKPGGVRMPVQKPANKPGSKKKGTSIAKELQKEFQKEKDSAPSPFDTEPVPATNAAT